MSLVLHAHPLSSYCHKVLIGLYDCNVAFEQHLVDLSAAEARAALYALSPLGKMPVLVDRERVICESTIILEYACPSLVPTEPAAQRETRYWDRFFDVYVHTPMQKIVADKLRAEGKKDPYGVDEAKAGLEKAYSIADKQLRGKTWVTGDAFTLADCAAGPALFYANKLVPFARYEHVAVYFARLAARPSYARTLAEAAPFMKYFPG